MTDTQLDATFFALADTTRRAILARLLEGDVSVTDLAAPFAISRRAISKHLQVLERAGLVERTRSAQRRPSRIRPEPLADVDTWLQRYRAVWEQRFDRLDARLAARKQTKGKRSR